MYCAKWGHIDVLKYLHRKEADINKVNEYGWNAIMHACAGGHLEIVKYLKNEKVSILLRDKDGATTLDIAREFNHSEIVAYLKSQSTAGGVSSSWFVCCNGAATL